MDAVSVLLKNDDKKAHRDLAGVHKKVLKQKLITASVRQDWDDKKRTEYRLGFALLRSFLSERMRLFDSQTVKFVHRHQ